MKRVITTIIVLLTACAFAGVEAPFMQFAPAAYCNPHGKRSSQPWEEAQLITLKVGAGTNVWLTNYVDSFFAGPRIPDLHGDQYDMVGTHKYGYIYADDFQNLEATNYESLIHWSNGETTDVTYFYDDNPEIKVKTTGYFLEHFNEDAEIFFVMMTLPEDGSETVDSYQYVYDENHDTTLVSRQHNTVDLAGNVRVNFGIDSYALGYIGREFVAVYDKPATSGQPLPGMAVCLLLAAGTIAGAKRIKD